MSDSAYGGVALPDIGNRLEAIRVVCVCVNAEQNESRASVAQRSFAMEIL